MDIIKNLDAEHKRIQAAVDNIRQESSRENIEALDKLLTDHICHEETLYALSKIEGNVGINLDDIRKDHQKMISLLLDMKSSPTKSQLDEFLAILDGHSQYEDEVVYPFFEKTLSDDQKRSGLVCFRHAD
ncbi:MAG: hemerythrin domain-containing protein [Nanoarchaeota archaeon]